MHLVRSSTIYCPQSPQGLSYCLPFSTLSFVQNIVIQINSFMYEGTEFFRKPYFSSNFTVISEIFSSPYFLEGLFLAYFSPSFLTACPFLKCAFPEVPQPWVQSSATVGQLELAGIGHSWQRLPCSPHCQHLSTNTQYNKNQRQAKNMNSTMAITEILVSTDFHGGIFLSRILYTLEIGRGAKERWLGRKESKKSKKEESLMESLWCSEQKAFREKC